MTDTQSPQPHPNDFYEFKRYFTNNEINAIVEGARLAHVHEARKYADMLDRTSSFMPKGIFNSIEEIINKHKKHEQVLLTLKEKLKKFDLS